MFEFWSLDNSLSKSIVDVLETIYLIFRKTVVQRNMLLSSNTVYIDHWIVMFCFWEGCFRCLCVQYKILLHIFLLYHELSCSISLNLAICLIFDGACDRPLTCPKM